MWGIGMGKWFAHPNLFSCAAQVVLECHGIWFGVKYCNLKPPELSEEHSNTHTLYVGRVTAYLVTGRILCSPDYYHSLLGVAGRQAQQPSSFSLFFIPYRAILK